MSKADTDKRIIYAEIESKDVKLKVFINDIEILKKSQSSFKTAIPINIFLVKGKNTFLCAISITDPIKKDPGGRGCKMKIYSRKMTGIELGTEMTTLSQVEIKATSEMNSEFMKSPVQFFENDLSIPNPVWATSVKIPQNSETERMILLKYREYYELLKQKNITELFKLNSSKFKSLSFAVYQDQAFYENKLKETLSEVWEDPGFNLVELTKQEPRLTYEYSNDSRLISIVNGDGRSPLQYYHKEEGITVQFKLYHYFDGKDFILIL